MANIYDYLDWRGDVPFDLDPFNEVDNLILSWLAYTDFEDVVPEPDWTRGSLTEPPEVFSSAEENRSVSVKEAAERYFSIHTKEELLARDTFTKNAPLLLEKLAASRRFEGLRLSAYVNLIDPERELQMSAVTYEVGDGTWYAAFRGTDDTLVGWKEDFDLSYREATLGQTFSKNYLESGFGRPGYKLMVGGHSKGGNFAVYASVFCNDITQNNIFRVYSNDGPGFIESVADSERFLSMLPRMIKIIPESSIIGILMNGHLKQQIIKSSEEGVMQHDAESWLVLRNRFVSVDARSEESLFVDDTIVEWLNGIGSEDRKLFIDNLFGLFDAAGVSTLEEYKGNALPATAAMLKGFNQLPEEHRKQFVGILHKLVKSGVKVLQDRGNEVTLGARIRMAIEEKQRNQAGAGGHSGE